MNGLLITYVGLPPFIATYGMLWVLFGFAYLILRGNVIYGFPAAFRFMGNGHLFGIPMPIVVMVAIFIASYILLYHTTLGQAFLRHRGKPRDGQDVWHQGQRSHYHRLCHQRFPRRLGWPWS